MSPRLSFPFVSIFTKQQSSAPATPSPKSPSRRSNHKESRPRRKSIAPVIKDRESSLYYVCCDSVSDTATAIPHHSHQQYQHHPDCLSPYSHRVYLNPRNSIHDEAVEDQDDEDSNDNEPLYFPSPPPRLSLHFDRRHTDLWDELFDFAEQYQSPASTAASRLTCSTQVDLRLPASRSRGNKLGLGGLGMRSEIWSKSYDTTNTHNNTIAVMSATTAPTVPPRSRLRAPAPASLDLHPSQFLLPVDEPLPQALESTPSLSDGSSDHGSPQHVPQSPEQEVVVFGRRKKSGANAASLGKDPMRIRDGQSARSSSSGVYTPPTFPGAQGPRPSHFPTHVYTPPSFALHPTLPRPTPNNYSYMPAAGPSRSASVSSAESDPPITPAAPAPTFTSTTSNRFSTFSGKTGKTMSGLKKRISHQITSISSSGNNTPLLPMTPHSAKDSYFPSTIHSNNHSASGTSTPHSRQSSMGPQTPTSATRPGSSAYAYQSSFSAQGLGVGLTENEGRTAGLSPERGSGKPHSVLFDHDEAGGQRSPQPKGKRKPVPRMLDETLEAKMNALQVETHAL